MKPGVPPPPPFMQPLPPPAMCKPTHRPAPVYRPPMNHQAHAQKYFYTVLFLDNYFHHSENKDSYMPRRNEGELKSYNISADTDTASIKWLDDNRLYVRHNLPLPITLEMWDQNNKPIVYCPILKLDVNNVTLGDVVINDERSVIINFYHTKKPVYNQIFKLSIKSLPAFKLRPDEFDEHAKSLFDVVDKPTEQGGIAFVFRRNSLDGLYDLISEFDQAYYHSLQSNSDLKYLTDKSCYKDVHFVTKYTNNLQDVLDLIDIDYYKVEYSWESHKKYKK